MDALLKNAWCLTWIKMAIKIPISLIIVPDNCRYPDGIENLIWLRESHKSVWPTLLNGHGWRTTSANTYAHPERVIVKKDRRVVQNLLFYSAVTAETTSKKNIFYSEKTQLSKGYRSVFVSMWFYLLENKRFHEYPLLKQNNWIANADISCNYSVCCSYNLLNSTGQLEFVLVLHLKFKKNFHKANTVE